MQFLLCYRSYRSTCSKLHTNYLFLFCADSVKVFCVWFNPVQNDSCLCNEVEKFRKQLVLFGFSDIILYEGESKVLQYFAKVWNGLAVPDGFAEIVMVKNHTRTETDFFMNLMQYKFQGP